MQQSATILLAAALLAPAAAPAQSSGPDAWENFNNWQVGDLLFGSMNLQGVAGMSSVNPADLALGEHDPARQPFSAQAIEPALSFKTPRFEAFSNYLWFQDEDGHWDGELEEAFGKILLPGGVSLKGGQFLSHLGVNNNRHSHAWDFVDADMTVSRFFGEEGLILRGAEITWELPYRFALGLTNIASVGFGKARSHGHGPPAPLPPGVLFDGEEAYLAEDILTARWISRHTFSDFHAVSAGLSYAGGHNEFGESTRVFGVDLGYQWRENGLEAGGRAFRMTHEFVLRTVSAFEDGPPPVSGRYEEFGAYLTGVYTWSDHFDSSLRLAWLEGVDQLDLEERFRISPAATWWLDAGRRVGLRAQYNYDRAAGESEHTAWLQLNLSLGSNVEVR